MRRVAPFALLLCSIAACAPHHAASARADAAEPFARRPALEASLLQADRDFARTVAEKGLEGWVSWFTSDGVQFPAKEGLAIGHAAIRRVMADAFADPTLELSWEPAEASAAASGDLGYTIGHAFVSKKGPGGTKVVVSKLKYLTVWKRQPDGSWKVGADLGNLDQP